MSRRSVLQGAATAGAAGLAVSAFGAAAAGPALAATSSSAAGPVSASASSEHDVAGHSDPIVVHVRNARTGDIEVFSGTSQTRLRDKDLAARIARAVG
ncbi:MAG: hypothetical protein ACRDPY_43655 [Streptosporangiaceae bacterium]